jgi:hypothetical protein
MPRPGCVWTHTLLLDPDAVRAASPSLLPLFRRPNGPEPATDPYRQALTAPQGAHAKRGQALEKWTEILAWSFYEPPERPVRALRMDLGDEERHELLVVVWMMAWPALRTTLSFCDAPRTQRALDDRPFDLQLQQTSKADGHDTTDARILRGLPSAEPPRWARELAAQPAPKDLARFIANHGTRLEPSRAFVRPLVRLFDTYSSRDARPDRRAEAVVAILGEEFPQAQDGIALKAQLLSTRVQEAPPLDDRGVLRGLVKTNVPQAFANADLDLPERVRRLYKSDAKSLWEVLEAINNDRESIADVVLNAAVDVGASDGFGRWSNQPPDTIRKLVKHRPVVLENADLWRAVDPSVLWPKAAAQRGVGRRTAIVQAIVDAGIESLSEPVTTAWSVGADLLLSALSHATGLRTSDLLPWLAPISSQTLLRFLSTDVEVTDGFAAAAVRGMDASAIATVGATKVEAALKGDPSIDTAVAAFLAALERPGGTTWADIGITAYCRVVDRASKDELGPTRERLRGVEPDLPEWDVVARVARAASEAFKDGRWPIEAALEIKDRAAFAALVHADKRAGLARAMLVRAASGDVKVTAWQSDLISSTIRERSDKDSLLKTIEGLARGIFHL